MAQTEGGDDVVVLELVEPTYDADAGTLTYGATILAEYAGERLAHVAERQEDAALPEAFGRASLFIDDCPDVSCCQRMYPNARDSVCVGDVVGANTGQCWSWGSFSCNPCNGWSEADYANVCNSTYTECEGNCFVDVGGA